MYAYLRIKTINYKQIFLLSGLYNDNNSNYAIGRRFDLDIV